MSPGAFAAPGKLSAGASDVAPGIIQVAKDLAAGTTQVTVTFSSTPAQAGLGLGAQGTPFAPTVLAKFGNPVQWTTSGKLASNADVTADAKGNGAQPAQTYTATVAVPDGAKRVWVQIANKGDQDGSYDKVDLALTVAQTTGPADTPPPETAPPSAPPSSSSSSGCSCHVPRTNDPTAGGIFAALMVVTAFALRRKRT
jgi:MYXO-CTERM domain-containing protein